MKNETISLKKENIAKYRGGKRANSGRKSYTHGKVLVIFDSRNII